MCMPLTSLLQLDTQKRLLSLCTCLWLTDPVVGPDDQSRESKHNDVQIIPRNTHMRVLAFSLG